MYALLYDQQEMHVTGGSHSGFICLNCGHIERSCTSAIACDCLHCERCYSREGIEPTPGQLHFLGGKEEGKVVEELDVPDSPFHRYHRHPISRKRVKRYRYVPVTDEENRRLREEQGLGHEHFFYRFTGADSVRRREVSDSVRLRKIVPALPS